MEPLCFSDISSSPDCRRDSSPPFGLLTLVIEIDFAAASTAAATFWAATFPLDAFSGRFFCRVRDEPGGFIFSLIAGTQPVGDLGPQALERIGADRRAHVAGWVMQVLFVVAQHEF